MNPNKHTTTGNVDEIAGCDSASGASGSASFACRTNNSVIAAKQGCA